MRKATYSIVATLVIFSLCAGSLHAQVASPREVDAIKQDVTSLYSATSKKIAVKLRSGTKLKGYIEGVGPESFTLRTNANQTDIRYENVASVSKTGLSKGQKWAIAGAVVGGLVVAGIVFKKKAKPGFSGIPCLLC